jgi:hypothetical protein
MPKVCPNCNLNLVGCACNHTTASDGKKVHTACKDEYENNDISICALCSKGFNESYFKAIDGRNVHFSCKQKYESQLTKK